MSRPPSTSPGREFAPEEFEPGRNRVAILGEGLWQRAFSGARDVLAGLCDRLISCGLPGNEVFV